MKREYVWTCDYCGKEFETEIKADKHEKICGKKHKNNQYIFGIKQLHTNSIFYAGLILIVLYFLSYFLINSYAQNNGLTTKKLLKPNTWFTQQPTTSSSYISNNIPTQTPSVIPTAKPIVKIVKSDIVNCTFDPRCNQKPMTLKESICNKMVCCNIGLDYWVVTWTMAECQAMQDKALEIYYSIYNKPPPMVYNQYVPSALQYQYQPVTIPTLSINIPTIKSTETNQNTDYSSICNSQLQTDNSNARTLGGGAGETMLQMAKNNYERCMSSGVYQPLKITKPTATPVEIKGIWYGNLGPLN